MLLRHRLSGISFFCMLLPLLQISCYPSNKQQIKKNNALTFAPGWMKGDFEDDYAIRYTISDSVWQQLPGGRYVIIRHHVKEQYLVARNDWTKGSGAGLYTRIDYMKFDNMPPWEWGYCLTVYDAPNDKAAETAAGADRENPKKGCNGFPFSRMKRK